MKNFNGHITQLFCVETDNNVTLNLSRIEDISCVFRSVAPLSIGKESR